MEALIHLVAECLARHGVDSLPDMVPQRVKHEVPPGLDSVAGTSQDRSGGDANDSLVL
jgi:hypothetical protein